MIKSRSSSSAPCPSPNSRPLFYGFYLPDRQQCGFLCYRRTWGWNHQPRRNCRSELLLLLINLCAAHSRPFEHVSDPLTDTQTHTRLSSLYSNKQGSTNAVWRARHRGCCTLHSETPWGRILPANVPRITITNVAHRAIFFSLQRAFRRVSVYVGTWHGDVRSLDRVKEFFRNHYNSTGVSRRDRKQSAARDRKQLTALAPPVARPLLSP